MFNKGLVVVLASDNNKLPLMVHLRRHGGRKCCPEVAALAAYHDDEIAKESACLTSNDRRFQSSNLQRSLT